MSYETELEKAKNMVALVVLDFKDMVARRYTSPLTNRKVTLSLEVPFGAGELTGELGERIRMDKRD